MYSVLLILCLSGAVCSLAIQVLFKFNGYMMQLLDYEKRCIEADEQVTETFCHSSASTLLNCSRV